MLGCRVHSCASVYKSVLGSLECGNEPLESIKAGSCLAGTVTEVAAFM
jgi:hypothetical protein